MSAANLLPFLLPLYTCSLGHLWSAQKVIPLKTDQGEPRQTATGELRIRRFGVRVPKGVPFLALIFQGFSFFRPKHLNLYSPFYSPFLPASGDKLVDWQLKSCPLRRS